MRRVAAMLLLLAVSLSAGCATAKKGETGGFMQRYSESRRLNHAVGMLESGDSTGAARELKGVSSGSAVPGVTDEALFRLALLSLKPSAERPVSPQAQRLLDRLRKEYPKSPWTVQAGPLIDLLDVADELRDQNKKLKGTNQSLTKEVGELNRTIEQLKRLDLEIEQRRR